MNAWENLWKLISRKWWKFHKSNEIDTTWESRIDEINTRNLRNHFPCSFDHQKLMNEKFLPLTQAMSCKFCESHINHIPHSLEQTEWKIQNWIKKNLSCSSHLINFSFPFSFSCSPRLDDAAADDAARHSFNMNHPKDLSLGSFRKGKDKIHHGSHNNLHDVTTTTNPFHFYTNPKWYESYFDPIIPRNVSSFWEIFPLNHRHCRASCVRPIRSHIHFQNYYNFSFLLSPNSHRSQR